MAKKKVYTIADLSTKKVTELHKIASEVGITSVKKYKKSELLQLLVGKEIVNTEVVKVEEVVKVKKSKAKPKKAEVKKITKPVKKEEEKLIKFHRYHSQHRSSMTWK